MADRRQIVALGGWPAPVDYLLELTGHPDPKVCLVPTASGDAATMVVRFYETFPSRRCRPTHVELFGVPPPDLRGIVLDQDLVWVGGGNTANMLAVWRLHELDEAMREAWEAGLVLAGWSAGAICWFEAGVTDSFRAELDGLDCLGFLPGSACPHYDGEEARRPAYHRLVREGFPAGVAADDGVGLRYEGTELADVVTMRREGRAYRVERVRGEVVEIPLDARFVG